MRKHGRRRWGTPSPSAPREPLLDLVRCPGLLETQMATGPGGVLGVGARDGRVLFPGRPGEEVVRVGNQVLLFLGNGERAGAPGLVAGLVEPAANHRELSLLEEKLRPSPRRPSMR